MITGPRLVCRRRRRADDLGWHDVGFRSNNQIHTPTIDKLASDGVVLDQYYVQDVCSPSRATFQTGRYPLHNTVNDWLRSGTATGLPLNETTMGDVFQRSGYATHAAGSKISRRPAQREQLEGRPCVADRPCGAPQSGTSASRRGSTRRSCASISRPASSAPARTP